jgi:predicted Zn-dependent peptidase
MSINRKIAPEFHLIESLHFPDYEILQTKNGFKLYSLRAGSQPVIRLDFVFDAGLIRQLKTAESAFAASMLSEGTKNRSALNLAESLDYYGSYFQTRSNPDDAVATLYCSEKHLENCLPLFLEAITDSVFPEKELDIQKKNSIQKLLVSEKKNGYLCRKHYYKNIFGDNHPYASFSDKSDLEKINRNSLISFHQNHYKNGLKYLLLSGNYSERALGQIDNLVSNIGFVAPSLTKDCAKITLQTGKFFIEKNDSVQSAIRIGKPCIGRTHDDFRRLQFLNLIFGGYFGSRLMKNIREDKGLTYGIYSVLETYKESATWYIDSDINTKNRENGLIEIYKEMAIIRDQAIPKAELETARNYYLGSFLRSLDGPFSLADRLKIMIDYQLPNSYYPDFVSVLYNTSALDLQELANKYLGEENIVELVVGKK